MIQGVAKKAFIGIDVGGTFTDLVLFREGEPVRFHKVLSTPRDPSIAVLQALDEIIREANLSIDDVARICHATTVVSNALLQRQGARTGLITSKGFRDVLEIGTEL